MPQISMTIGTPVATALGLSGWDQKKWLHFPHALLRGSLETLGKGGGNENHSRHHCVVQEVQSPPALV